MKKLILILANLLVVITAVAQSPEMMNYQAVARDLSGLPLVNTTVNLQFDILEGASTGTVVYSETQTKSTNQFGLFTAEIGSGGVVSGSFPAIAWGANSYYLRVTVNGDVMPASQLLSVPYALHSKTTGGVGTGLVPGSGIDISGGVITATSDTSSTNELQVLSISNDTIFLSNGGFVELPSSLSDTDWVVGAGIVYNQNDNVGIGTAVPNYKLTTLSSDTVIGLFTGANPSYAVVAVTNTPLNPNASTGMIFLTGADTGAIGLNPMDKQFVINNSTTAGHITLNADSSVISYAQVLGQSGDKIVEKADTILSFGKTTNNVINVNQGTYITDSLYKLGTNSGNANWVLANNGFGQAVWTDPSTLGLASNIWNQGTGNDIYNNTDSVGIGVVDPQALFHVSGGGVGKPIALFEKGGFFTAMVDINSTSSNGSGINFRNGTALTGSITSSTTNLMNISATNVVVGTGNATGKLQVNTSSSVANPTLQLHETSTGFSRIKHTNTVAGGKYWITEAGINATDANSGYSISYFDGGTSKIPFIVYGDSKVGINNLATPLASFHVMDNSGTGNGIASEGFSQAGQVVIARNNFTFPNRGAIQNGDEIGRLSFSGYGGTVYGNGPQITAYASENFTNTTNGSNLIFSTVANGTNTNTDALRILNDGTVEVPQTLRVLAGAGTAGSVLTSDAAGNASWQAATSSPFSRNAPSIYTTALTDNVGIGLTTPSHDLHIQKPDPATIMVESTGVNGNDVFVGIKSPAITWLMKTNRGDQIGGNQGDFFIRDETNGRNVMLFDINGNVGIGTTAPNAKLDVTGITETDNLRVLAGAGTAGHVLTSDATGNASWQALPSSASYWNGSAGLVYLATAGDNVGLGTTAPSTKLDIFGASTSTSVSGYWTSPETTIKIHNTNQTNNNFSALTFATTLSNGGSTEMGRMAVQNVNHTVGSESGDFVFSTRNTGSMGERMRLTGSGNLGVGTGAPTARLHVNGNFRLVDGTQGAGRILTSDANGNASWALPTKVAFFAGNDTGTDMVIPLSPDIIRFGSTSPRYFNIGGALNTTTGVFTAPVSGVYHFAANTHCVGPTSNYVVLALRVNNVVIIDWKQNILSGGNRHNPHVSGTIHLDAGDTVDITIDGDIAGGNIEGTSTSFSGHLVYRD